MKLIYWDTCRNKERTLISVSKFMFTAGKYVRFSYHGRKMRIPVKDLISIEPSEEGGQYETI